MSQGFTHPLNIPVPVSQGGTGQVSQTGSGLPVAQTAPTINQANLVGTTTNDNAATGSVGEFVSSVILNASPVSIATATPTNLTSISLTAGDWDVWGNIYFDGSSANVQDANCWVSSTSATLPDQAFRSTVFTTSVAPSFIQGPLALMQRFSLASTTTIYITGYVDLGGGATCNMRGGIYARRIR